MVERTEDHRYFVVDGATRFECLGVTRTLVEANLVDDAFFTERSRGRGKLVHEIAERIFTNTLAKPIDASALPFMTGVRKFLDRYGPTVTGTEVVLAHAARRMAGTVDLEIIFEREEATVEIKTSTPALWHGLQLAPYAFLRSGAKWAQRRRFGLYLNERGGFRLKEYDDLSDLDYFLRAFELLHWRIRHGSFEKPYGRRSVDAGLVRGDRDPDFADPFARY